MSHDGGEQFRLLFEAAADAIFVEDTEGRVLDVNPAACALHGMTREELIGRTVLELVPESDRANVAKLFSHLGEEDFKSLTARSLHKDGRAIPVEIRVSRIRYHDRPALLLHVRDLTGRESIEKALFAAEQRFRIMVENAPDGINICERTVETLPDGTRRSQRRLIFCNERYVEMSGRTREELMAADDLNALSVSHNSTAKVKENWQRADSRRSFAGVSSWIRPDGRENYYEWIAIPLELDGKELVMGIDRDITERRQASEALLRTERRLLAHNATTMILSEATSLAEVTPRILQTVCECLEWDVGELWSVHKKENVLRCVEIWHNPSLSLPEFRLFSRQTALSPGIGLPGRVWASGEPDWIADVTGGKDSGGDNGSRRQQLHSAIAFPIRLGRDVLGVMAFFSRQVRDPDPELLQMLASVGGQIGQFIDRTRAEEALRESNRRLEEAVKELQSAQHQVIQQERLRALGQMAGGIAHDFNNALAPILGFSELLLARPQSLTDTAKVRHYLETMNTAARDAAAVVRRLREFYRPREESEVFLPVNLNELVNQAVAMTRPRWKDQAMGSGAGIRMITELARLPMVAGVASELREVLTNLIFNAVDAMPRGGTIAIRTRLENNSVVLEVTDSGVGMTDEVREHCLDPFYSTKGERGTGLGLSIVYGIVRRHEGSVEIESEPGRGTTFRIKLPAQSGVPTVAAALSSRGPTKRLNILLVDDEPLVREIQTEYLTGEGHRVDTAPDGQQAIHLFARGPFDVVITDQAMPGMTGDQVAAAVKQMSPLTPVILLTGFGDMMLATGEKPAGVDLVLSKPISISGLRDAVEKLCGDKTVLRPVTDGEPVETPA